MISSTDFEVVAREHTAYIRRVASSQWIAGMDYDDVVAEMLVCLWNAHETWDAEKNPSFKNYWWRLWANRKFNLVRNQQRRIQPHLTDELELLDAVSEQTSYPEPPSDFTQQDRVLWGLIAYGFQRQDIFDLVGMSEWKYRMTMRRWRDHADLRGLVYEE